MSYRKIFYQVTVIALPYNNLPRICYKALFSIEKCFGLLRTFTVVFCTLQYKGQVQKHVLSDEGTGKSKERQELG